MKYFSTFEALKTECQTPGVNYEISIKEDQISIKVDMNKKLDIDEKEAELLEKNIHNMLELILSKYFI